MAQNEVKAARLYATDVASGVQREWYKVGRRNFAIDSDGDMLDADGYIIARIDAYGDVISAYDNNAYRVSEAIRKWYAVGRRIDANWVERSGSAATMH